jgi:hypothetical protein
MSEEGSFGVSMAEKFFGLIIFAVGLVALYYTLTSATYLLMFTGFFAFLCLVLVALGLVMMIAKTE